MRVYSGVQEGRVNGAAILLSVSFGINVPLRKLLAFPTTLSFAGISLYGNSPTFRLYCNIETTTAIPA